MTDFIIFFKTEAALDGFVQNAGTVGVNGSLTAGPLGREAEALITTKSKEGIIVFASSKGLYGGVSIEFGGVMANSSANQNQYGRPVTPAEIFESESAPKGDPYDKMYSALDDLMNQEIPDETPSAAAKSELPADEQVVASQ
ncbi:SH3 domain-containing YSC84-like protein 1 [Hondaea fermentalgiana]|uniref:SH3 domain-containing YSC84-like protein 1 n=1 Tax=Hondaea fermentalgiana TaxID=2315210 RepID=A0A2R5GHJ2_9STRA|nr:SH3 domain-containing YSC84-like protein 1 [Hondaea fermentalgiana]|eukprot:GBG28113.1 SH3 domain-containing YSC84-like protein 1 [Hondaea fermentalgiana]